MGKQRALRGKVTAARPCKAQLPHRKRTVRTPAACRHAPLPKPQTAPPFARQLDVASVERGARRGLALAGATTPTLQRLFVKFDRVAGCDGLDGCRTAALPLLATPVVLVLTILALAATLATTATTTATAPASTLLGLAVTALVLRAIAAVLAIGGLTAGVILAQSGWLLGERFIPLTLSGWLWLFGLAYLPASFGAVALLVQPVGTAILGWIVLNEVVTLDKALGIAAVLAGIWLARKGTPKVP